MSRVTPMDAKAQVDRLVAAGFNLPPKTSVQQLAQSWAEAMGDIDERDLIAAVDDYRRTGHYWPKPADLRVRAAEARKTHPRAPGQQQASEAEYWAWEAHQHDEQGRPLPDPPHGRGCSQCQAGCPVCRARYEFQPRLIIVHDERRHEDAGIGWSGYCRADVEFYRASDAARDNVDRARREQEEERQRAAALAQLEREQVARKMGTMAGQEAAD